MWIISRHRLLEFSKRYGGTQQALDLWYRRTKKSHWKDLTDVRRDFPTADGVGNFTVFNIKGNQFRLIVDISYPAQRIYIKYFLTHSEYDKNEWKRDPHY